MHEILFPNCGENIYMNIKNFPLFSVLPSKIVFQSTSADQIQ